MILLVDADILLFRMCFSHERTIDWGGGVESKLCEPEQAKDRIEKMTAKMVKFCHCTEAIMCFTHRKNFRYNVYPDYKANRKYKKFEMIHELKKWMEAEYRHRRMEMLEADDVMGILATKHPDKYVIATIDKDLKQIPGRHYNWDNNKRTLVCEEVGDLYFYTQILTGDVVDNYKGCPGIGPKKAAKILNDIWALNSSPQDEWWEAIVAAYANKDLPEEHALQMARVARILRVEDYNFETMEPILWTPNNWKGE